jgi:N-acetylmuramoyl-L-alanine amidase-like protein
VRRLLSAFAIGCAAALIALAAPALSLSPYRPDPVDFELAPGSAASAASNGTLVSRPLRAPHGFNLVGLRWRGRAEPSLAIRVRKAGGRWSRWAKLSSEQQDGPDPGSREAAHALASAPLWVGQADQVQYRTSRRLARVRVHFVNVTGTATTADGVRTAIRRAANTAVVSLGHLFGASTAQAQGGPPGMVMRDAWGAQDCPPRSAPAYGEVKAAFIHHTVSLNDYSPEEAPGIVLAICRYHRNSNGWNDIGYNFLVDKYGTLYEGRAGGIDQPVVGAQAQGYNTQTTGIANIGTYTDVPQTQEALQAMAALIRWKLPLHGAPTAGTTTLRSGGGGTNRYPSGRTITVDRVIGHRDTNSTECPGEMLYAQLTELRRMVGDLSPAPVLKAPPSRARTAMAATLAPRLVRYGRRVRVNGRLRKAGGKRLAGRRVEVQALRGRTWHTVSRLKTSSTGAFTVLLRPKVTRLVRARFRGNGTLRASASKAVQLIVLPVVSLEPPPARGAAGTRVRLAGTVKPPSKRSLVLVVQLRRRGRWLSPGYKAVRARDGQFSAAFRPGRQGTWRFYVATIADRFHGRGESRKYQLRVGR